MWWLVVVGAALLVVVAGAGLLEEAGCRGEESELVKNPRRSSGIYMYITESMIKFIPLSFLKQSAKPLHIHIEYY